MKGIKLIKNIFLSFLIIFLFIQCSKEIESGNEVQNLDLTTIPGWPTIDFKLKYTIQVPSGFIGSGLEGFEGKSFYKASPDHNIILYGGYSNGLFIFDFGDTLQNTSSQSIQVSSTRAGIITLDQIEYFYQKEELKGILYYSPNDLSLGRLYWKDENAFKNALNIDFKLSELGTVNKIIQSIKPKQL